MRSRGPGQRHFGVQVIHRSIRNAFPEDPGTAACTVFSRKLPSSSEHNAFDIRELLWNEEKAWSDRSKA